MSDGPKLGELIPLSGVLPHRDAIHIAVLPVTASEPLKPGQYVSFTDPYANIVGVVEPDQAVGVVDPFLTRKIKKGEQFWMFLKPNTITGLRHQWEHPGVDHRAKVYERMRYGDSIERLRDFAAKIDVEYDELIQHSIDYVQTGSTWYEGSKFSDATIYLEFWGDIRKVTGIDTGKRDAYDMPFSCSC